MRRNCFYNKIIIGSPVALMGRSPRGGALPEIRTHDINVMVEGTHEGVARG